MNINELAELDLQTTLEDQENGFARDIELTNLDGEKQTVQCQYHRISVEFDPESGMRSPIMAPKSAVTVRNSSIQGIITKDWKVSIYDINGNQIVGTISTPPLPDYALGITTFFVREEEVDV